MDFLPILVWILCGVGCYLLAEKKGYNKALAAVLGVLGGVIALIIYACLGNKNKE